jgi:nitroimidazol reductase NimA-like FMN-containing flavoprotein (pyridoxamine 5'-phosphate oxidase superfamily)
MSDQMLDQLSDDTCVDLLRIHLVGRISVVVDEFPIVMPVNYRFVESRDARWIVFRTRPGNEIDRGGANAAFQIDSVDPAHRGGWSVLVRGELTRLDSAMIGRLSDQLDPQPWVSGRESWLALEATKITGRRLRSAEIEWAFHVRGYL